MLSTKNVVDQKRRAFVAMRLVGAMKQRRGGQLKVVATIVGGHCGKQLRSGFTLWRWTATKLRRATRTLHLIGRLALTSAGDRTTAAFVRWCGLVAQRSGRELAQRGGGGVMVRTLQQMCGRRCSAAIRRWRGVTVSLFSLRRRGAGGVGRFLRHLMKHKLARGWHNWQSRSGASQRYRRDARSSLETMGRVAGAMTLRRQRTAFNSLSQLCAGARRRAARHATGLRQVGGWGRRLFRRAMRRRFRWWATHAAEQRQQREWLRSVLRVAFDRDHKDLARAWARWMLRTRSAAHTRQQYALQELLAARVLEQALHMLGASLKGKERRRYLHAWQDWKRHLHAARGVDLARKRFMHLIFEGHAKSHESVVQLAFSRLRSVTRRIGRTQLTLRSIVMRLHRTKRRLAFNSWVLCCRKLKQDAAFLEEALAAANRAQAGSANTVCSILTQVMQLKKGKAWRTWLTHVKKVTVRLRSHHFGLNQCGSLLASRARRNCWAGFRHWREAAQKLARREYQHQQACKEAEALAAAKRGAVRRACGGLANLKLLSGWHSWRKWVRDAAVLEAGLANLTRCRKRLALGQWRSFSLGVALGARMALRLITTFEQRLRHGLKDALRRWVANAHAVAQEQRATLAMRRNEVLHGQALLARTVRQIQRRSVFKGFTTWLFFNTEMRRQEKQAAQVRGGGRRGGDDEK